MKLLRLFSWRLALYRRGLLVSVFSNNGFRHWHRLGPRMAQSK